MTGKVNLLAVTCIIVVAAAQVAASGMLVRMRRQTPPLPAAQAPMVAPRPPPLPNLWSCCPRMPSVIKIESKPGCLPNLPAVPMPGGAMPMLPPAGGPSPLPGGAPIPGGMPMPGMMPMPGGVPTPGMMPMPGGMPMPGMSMPGGAPPGMPRPGGIPPMRRTNNPGNYSCFIECTYKNQSLVSGGVLSADAVKARVNELATANPAWSDVLKAAALACTVAPPVVGVNAPCKSGAAEINSCITHYVLKNCPTTIRVESDRCTALRNNVTIPVWG